MSGYAQEQPFGATLQKLEKFKEKILASSEAVGN